MTSSRLLLISIVLIACGGARASGTTTGGDVTAERAGACYTESLGVCQTYYRDDPTLADAQAGCVHSEVPNTSGAWVPECPSAGRVGDCNDVNGNLQARFYASTQYSTAADAETACEQGGGVWSTN